MKIIIKRVVVCIIFSLSVLHTAAQGSWTEKAHFGGKARRYASGFSFGNYGYEGGGSSYDGTYYYTYSDFWQYNPATDKWIRKANIGGGLRQGAVGFSIGNKGFICGGDSSGVDMEEYDPNTDTWKAKTRYPGAGVFGTVAFTISGKAYVGLGEDHNQVCKNDFWEYDTATGKWTKMADFPGGIRQGAGGFAIGNKGYISCGGSFSNSNSIFYNDCWEYNPLNSTWTQKAGIKTVGRYGVAGFNLNNKGYIGFGYVDGGRIINDLWTYDSSADQWTEVSSCDTSYTTFAPVSFVTGNHAYVGTGFSTREVYLNNLWQYSDGSSAIKPETNKMNFSVYPNPATGPFEIQSSDPIYYYEICNINGRKMDGINSHKSGNSIYIESQLPAGMYFVRVVSSNGTSVQKVVIGG